MQQYLTAIDGMVEEKIANGYTCFLSGGAVGVDTDFAFAVLKAKERFCRVRLVMILPCQNQDLKWGKSDKERYRQLLSLADNVIVLSDIYTNRCMQERNEYMVNHSDLVIAFWNRRPFGGTYNTIQYATKLKKPIQFYYL